jgi:hypothetical protein
VFADVLGACSITDYDWPWYYQGNCTDPLQVCTARTAYVVKDILCQLVFAVCIGTTGNRQMKRKYMDNYTLKYHINLLKFFNILQFCNSLSKKCKPLFCQHKVDNLLQG